MKRIDMEWILDAIKIRLSALKMSWVDGRLLTRVKVSVTGCIIKVMTFMVNE